MRRLNIVVQIYINVKYFIPSYTKPILKSYKIDEFFNIKIEPEFAKTINVVSCFLKGEPITVYKLDKIDISTVSKHVDDEVSLKTEFIKENAM